MNLKTFFNSLSVSGAFPSMTGAQVQGMTRLLDVWGQWYSDEPIQLLAAALTQIRHETGRTMLPVMETYATTPQQAASRLEKAFKAGQLEWVEKPYWNPDKDGLIWVGRGDIQITHKPMYATLRKAIKERFEIDIPLDENPELALDPIVSAVIAFEGMLKGLFRKKKLADYLKDGKMDYPGQRAVVNGDGKDKDIIKVMKKGGEAFEAALLAAGADKGITPTETRYFPTQPKPEEPPKPDDRTTAIQKRLHALGYGHIVSTIDGRFGPKTFAAIKAFEADHDIKLDHVDAATWEALQKPAAGEAA